MSRTPLFRVALALLVTSVLTLSGCIFDRKDPVPQFAVTVTPDVNLYLLDGQPMAFDQLEAQLKALADKYRASGTGNARAALTCDPTSR